MADQPTLRLVDDEKGKTLVVESRGKTVRMNPRLESARIVDVKFLMSALGIKGTSRLTTATLKSAVEKIRNHRLYQAATASMTKGSDLPMDLITQIHSYLPLAKTELVNKKLAQDVVRKYRQTVPVQEGSFATTAIVGTSGKPTRVLHSTDDQPAAVGNDALMWKRDGKSFRHGNKPHTISRAADSDIMVYNQHVFDANGKKINQKDELFKSNGVLTGDYRKTRILDDGKIMILEKRNRQKSSYIVDIPGGAPQLHSFNGNAAVETTVGFILIMEWYDHGRLHRDGDLPAFVSYANGKIISKAWYRNGNLQREWKYNSEE